MSFNNISSAQPFQVRRSERTPKSNSRFMDYECDLGSNSSVNSIRASVFQSPASNSPATLKQRQILTSAHQDIPPPYFREMDLNDETSSSSGSWLPSTDFWTLQSGEAVTWFWNEEKLSEMQWDSTSSEEQSTPEMMDTEDFFNDDRMDLRY